jgi:hypothetical protein
MSKALGSNVSLQDIAFSQYSRPNDDTRAAANPIAALARMRRMSESALTSGILKQDEDFHYLQRAQCHKAALELRDSDPAAYEVSAVTYAIAAQDNGNGTFKVAFSNVLEATTGELANAAAEGPFKFVATVGGNELGAVRFQSDAVRERVGTINHGEIVANLPAGKHQGRMYIDTGRKWIVCKMGFQLPLDQTTNIDCERFKFPPLFQIRGSNIATVDRDSQGKFSRYRQPDLREPHNCKGLETHGDTDHLSPDSKLAILLRQVKVGNDSTCLSCHTISDSNSYPGLFCPKKEGGPFDPYGRPKEVVEIGPVLVRYFMEPKLQSVPKFDRTEEWGGDIEAMERHFQALFEAYCTNVQVQVPRRNATATTETIQAHEIFNDFLKPFWPPNTTVTRDALCQKYRASGGNSPQ